VHKADTLSVDELSVAITALTERARNGELTMADVEGGTFTASNLGMYGIDSGFPIPRAPAGAIMLIGAARARPAVHNHELAIRQIATFSLTFDHIGQPACKLNADAAGSTGNYRTFGIYCV
jgi:pyruvate dehydrogenase E2 component (dihydrolipoamide acetyltransferase)